MKQNWLFVILLLPAVLLAGCAGYRSVNQTTGDVDISMLRVDKVEVVNVQRQAGERRVAQNMQQELSRRFTGGINAPLGVVVHLTEYERAISARRDATIRRFMLTLDANVDVSDVNGNVLAVINTRTESTYDVEDSPFASTANKKQAERTASEVMIRDIHRQLNLFLHDYMKKNK